MEKEDQQVQELLDLGLEPKEQKGIINSPGTFHSPRVFAASALFTTRNNNQPRELIKGKKIATAPGVGTLEYRGEELRYNDLEVWQVIIELGRTNQIQKSNHTLRTNVYQVLKLMEWNTSGREYKQLRDCLERLKATALSAVSESGNAIHSVSLIARFTILSTSELEIVLDPEIYKLFQADLALLSFKDLKNMPALTRKVYEILKAEPSQDLSVTNYMELSGNNYKHARQFKPRLINALKQLQAGGYIEKWSISKVNIVSAHLTNNQSI